MNAKRVLIPDATAIPVSTILLNNQDEILGYLVKEILTMKTIMSFIYIMNSIVSSNFLILIISSKTNNALSSSYIQLLWDYINL